MDQVDPYHDRAITGGIVNLHKLRKARQDAGLSMDHAAAFAGVGRNTLQRLEAGRSDPRISTLRRILDLYGERLGVFLSVGDFLDR
jgi:predicted transcriptional regulator